MKSKRVWITALGVLIALGAFGATQGFGANSQPNGPATLSDTKDPFEGVTVPTGPELSLERIIAIADEAAAHAGDPAPSGMSIGTGTLEEGMRSMGDGYKQPEPVSSQGFQNLLSTPIALVILRGQFTLNDASVPPGDSIPTASVMSLMIDTHKGDIFERGLPTPEQLQHIETTSPAQASSRGTIAVHRVSGTIVGVLRVDGGPPSRHDNEVHAGAAVVVTAGTHKVKVAHTFGSAGRFTLHIAPGTFVLSGTIGGRCRKSTVVVRPSKTTHVALQCSIL